MASGTVVLDVPAICSSCEAAFACASAWEAERLREALVGHVRLLLPEVEVLVQQMSGDTQRTAYHVIDWARDLLASDPPAGSARAVRVHDLAVVCRALLTLHEDPRLIEDARPAASGVTGQVLYVLVLMFLLGALGCGVARS